MIKYDVWKCFVDVDVFRQIKMKKYQKVFRSSFTKFGDGSGRMQNLWKIGLQYWYLALTTLISLCSHGTVCFCKVWLSMNATSVYKLQLLDVWVSKDWINICTISITPGFYQSNLDSVAPSWLRMLYSEYGTTVSFSSFENWSFILWKFNLKFKCFMFEIWIFNVFKFEI